MRSICTILFFSGILWSLVSCSGYFDLSKEAVTENINNWYASIGEEYRLELKGSEVRGEITSHNGLPKEQCGLIKIKYRGMRMELSFMKPIAEITIHKDSLQKYFHYISINDVYNEISTRGWETYPHTSQSSLRGEGVDFTGDGDVLGFQVKWSIYAVLSYGESDECKELLSITDMPSNEACFVAVGKTLPLEITVSGVVLD
ncbi:MAG: hypothetical protein ACI9Y7_003065 [Dokdonia sp.]|jgi:hypothetical protein